MYLDNLEYGRQDVTDAVEEKQTQEHDVIDEVRNQGNADV